MTSPNVARVSPTSSAVGRTRILLAAAALLTLSIGSIAGYGSASTATTAEYLLDIYETTRAKLLEMIEAAVNWSVGMTSGANASSEACTQLKANVEVAIAEGDALAEQARAALEAGDADKAAVLAIRAINALTRAFVQATVCIGFSGVTGNQTHAPPAPPAGLMAAITRLEVKLSRLMATAKAAAASGMNVSGAMDLLQEASAELQAAREAALEGDVRDATMSIARANQLMGKAISILRAASTTAMEHRVKEFCQGGNCAVRVLNLTKMTEKLREKIMERCRALGLGMNLTTTGMQHEKGHGPPGNVTATPVRPPKSGEHPGPGHEIPAPPAAGEVPPEDQGRDHCPPKGCGG